LRAGKFHIEAYQATPLAELVAICDANETVLHAVGIQYNIPPAMRFTRYEDMLAKAALDVVSVALPNALHPSATISALEAGLHVVCEKPMANTVAAAQTMLDAARQHPDQHLMITYNFRCRPDAQWMHDMVQSGALGEIYHANISWRRETGIPGSASFSSRSTATGGALMDIGVHALDLALWMLGFPRACTVSGHTRAAFGPRRRKIWSSRIPGSAGGDDFGVEDGAIGFLRMDGGLTMLLQATWGEHAKPGEDRLYVELQGTEGTAVLDIPNYTRGDTLRFYSEIGGAPVASQPKVEWGERFHHGWFIHESLDRIRRGEAPVSDGAQGMAAVQILEAVYRSAAAGHEVVIE
jgi:predicted dehydrogenase